MVTFSNIFNSIHCAPVCFRLPKRCYLYQNQKKMAPFLVIKPRGLLVSFNKLLKWKFWANSAQLSNPSASKRGHKHQAVPKRAMLEGKGTILLVPAAWHHSWSNFNPYDIQHSVRISSQNPCCFWVEATELWGDGEMWVLWGFTPTIAMFPKSFWYL